MYIMLLTLLSILPFLCASAQEWDRVPRWADVYLRGEQGFSDLEYKLGFLMDNYDVISLEKCLNNPENDWNTEAVFVDLVSRMRTLRPESEAKIIFYWQLSALVDCYDVLFSNKLICYNPLYSTGHRRDHVKRRPLAS